MLKNDQLGAVYQNTVDATVRSQLENLLTGATEGWGTSGQVVHEFYGYREEVFLLRGDLASGQRT